MYSTRSQEISMKDRRLVRLSRFEVFLLGSYDKLGRVLVAQPLY